MLVALVLLFGAQLAGAAPAQLPKETPQCSRVEFVAPVMDGMYSSVTCPEGTLTVSIRAGASPPAVGRASVATNKRTSAYTLRDKDGWVFSITNFTPKKK